MKKKLAEVRLPMQVVALNWGWQVVRGNRVVAAVGGHTRTPADDEEAERDALRFARSEGMEDACRKALPVVARLCNALGEACDEEAAGALFALQDAMKEAQP